MEEFRNTWTKQDKEMKLATMTNTRGYVVTVIEHKKEWVQYEA